MEGNFVDILMELWNIAMNLARVIPSFKIY